MSPAVVFVILDGVGARWVRPDVMPTLHALATSGAWHPDGSEAVLCSATYPNILTLLTGHTPGEHRVFANGLFDHGSTAEARVRTVFERAGSRASEFVVGDQYLIDVARGRTAGSHWPPEGVLSPASVCDDFGYATDADVLPHALAAVERRPDLLIVHFNGPDTACHLHGPESESAAAAYATADGCLATLVEELRPRWNDVLLLIASDHDQETVREDLRVDLAGLAASRGVEATVFHEGTAAIVLGRDAHDVRWFDGVAGVEQSWLIEPGVRMVTTDARYWFAGPEHPDRRGGHGGRRTAAQVAVASGGHPMVAEIAAQWRRRRPRAEDWTGLALAGLR